MKCRYETSNGRCGLKESYAYRHKCFGEDMCKCIEPMTNGDRIRSMTDEELGKLLFDLGYEAYAYALKPNLKPIADTQAGWIDWVKQPVEVES